jgi:hypothetical protein
MRIKLQKPCKCNCGNLAPPGKKYIYAHNRRKKFLRETPPQMYCLCGCGDLTMPGRLWLKCHNRRGCHNPNEWKKGNKIWDNPKTKSTQFKKGEHRSPETEFTPESKYCFKKDDKRTKEAGSKAIHTLIENSPYIWEGVGFLSKQEMECAKILLTKPIKGVNCHIQIGSKTIDFFPQLEDKIFIGCFVEYHPGFNEKRTPEEYYEERQMIIEHSEYFGIPLILVTSLYELEGETNES